MSKTLPHEDNGVGALPRAVPDNVISRLTDVMVRFTTNNGMTRDQGLVAKPEEVQAVVADSWQP